MSGTLTVTLTKSRREEASLPTPRTVGIVDGEGRCTVAATGHAP
jgi:hypothetical protein